MKHQIASVKWRRAPDKQDYVGAASYLELLVPPKQVRRIIATLKDAKITQFAAKDIFRASALPLLEISQAQVQVELERVKNRVPLSPLMLVRDPQHGKVIVADGYHRLCAVYGFDEHARVPCRIVCM